MKPSRVWLSRELPYVDAFGRHEVLEVCGTFDEPRQDVALTELQAAIVAELDEAQRAHIGAHEANGLQVRVIVIEPTHRTS